jgi:hypothetical protein
MFAPRDAFRFNTSEVEKEEALEIAASMASWISDVSDVWNDRNMSQQLEYARCFAAFIEAHGYACYIGHHGQKLLDRGKAPLAFNVGLISILKTEDAVGERYALGQLDRAWETLERDRVPIPPEA